MPKGKHAERIKKGRHDTSTGSSLGAGSGRSLRPRREKRAPEQEIEEVDASLDEDDVEDEPYRIEPRHGKGPVHDDDEMTEGEEEEEVDENDPAEEDAPVTLEVRQPIGPASRRVTNYYEKGMTDVVRRLRRTSPLNVEKTATDYRFWTSFQQDFYATVIMRKTKITSEAQFIDWEYMRKQNNPVFNEIIRVCTKKRVKNLMDFKHSWNKEIIAQFYATVYFGYYEEDGRRERAMHWMTEGELFHISYSDFASLLGVSHEDDDTTRIHDRGVLDSSELKFMYPRNRKGNWGKVSGLYTYYGTLYRMLRKTLTPRDGNTSDISLYQRNLMYYLRIGEDTPPFSVTSFIWHEIKTISESPQKICAYSPFIMLIIEKVTRYKVKKDAQHKPLRPPVPHKPLMPSPPHEDPPQQSEHEQEGQHEHIHQIGDLSQQQQHSQQPLGETGLTGSPNRYDRFDTGVASRSEKRSPPIKKLFNMFNGMCKIQRDIQVDLRKQRIDSKKTRDAIKKLRAVLSPDNPPSPISSPPELLEIPPLRDIVTDHMKAGYFEEFQDIFGYGPIGSSSQPPPPPHQSVGAPGQYTYIPTSEGDTFGSSFAFPPTGSTSIAAASYPFSSYAVAGISSMAGVQLSSAPSPSPGDFASQAAASIFGPTRAPSHGFYWTSSSSSDDPSASF